MREFEVVIMVDVFDRRDGWVELSVARKITAEPWDGILAKFQQQRTDALLGLLGEVLSRGDAVGRRTLRSLLLGHPSAIFFSGRTGRGQKDPPKEKLLTTPTLLEMDDFRTFLTEFVSTIPQVT